MLEIVRVAGIIFSFVTIVLLFLSLTKLGRVKLFIFTVGGFAFITTIACAVWYSLEGKGLAPYLTASWYFIAMLFFALAAWRAKE